MVSKLDRLMMLQEEVKIAKKFVKENGPEDVWLILHQQVGDRVWSVGGQWVGQCMRLCVER